MPGEDHLEGRDVDAEFAAIIAGWGLTPDLSTIERDTDDESNADAPTTARGASGEPGSEDEDAPSEGAADAPPSGAPLAPDLPSMPGFPNIASALPVPTPQPAPVEREVPAAGPVEASLDDWLPAEP